MTKVTQVPKDVRGPRFISSEPLEYMFAQQAIRVALEKRVARKSRGRVNFNDQLAHRSLMLSGRYASIDLSDASDWISRRTVWNCFPPDWRELMFSARSTFIRSGRKVRPIRAFAPMGSALCFSVMGTLIGATLKSAGIRDFSVYGDDVLVPREEYYVAIGALSAMGLKPNFAKCCNGKFVESCGLDLVTSNGYLVDVTPTYIRALHDTPVCKCNLIPTARSLCAAGFETLAARLFTWIRTSCLVPMVNGSGFEADTHVRIRRRYQHPVILVDTVKPVSKSYRVDGFEGLHRWSSERTDGEPTSLRATDHYVVRSWVPLRGASAGNRLCSG